MSFPKDHSYTHDENRSKVCLFCLKKRGRSGANQVREITKNGQIELLVNGIFEYDASNTHLPNGICKTCLNKLYASKDQTKKLLEIPKMSYNCKTIKTRSSADNVICGCLICQLARHRPGISKQNTSKTLQKIKNDLEG